MSKSTVFHSIPEAIAAVQKGEVIIVVDDENRENEGDFIAAAEQVTPEMINFMATHGRGLICTPLTEKRCEELQLSRMVNTNTDPLETAFTVSVDLKGNGVTTGISASDRCQTVKALVDPNIQAHQLSKPGHVFPLIAKEGGVLRRTGHTEAAIDFARLAGFNPAGVIVEIMNEDGSMARLPELIEVAKKFNLKLVSIENLVSYRMQHDSLILKKMDHEIQTRFGKFRLSAYEQTTTQQIHIALTTGEWSVGEPILTRINSTRISDDILGLLTTGIDRRLEDIFRVINKEGKGAILFIQHHQASENLLLRLEQLTHIQKKGVLDKTPPLPMDERDFGIGAQILHDLNINKLKVMTNSSQKPRIGLTGYGLEISSYVNY